MMYGARAAGTLTPQRSAIGGTIVLVVGVLLAVGAAVYGAIESRRTEMVVIAVRAVPFGQRIAADDLTTVALPLHRPVQLVGIRDPAQVIGRWAARTIVPNDLVQPSMVQATPPDQPVYPSGEQLDEGMVPVPFSTVTIGPLTERDRLNIGFSDPSGDASLCQRAGTPAVTDSAPARGHAFACRLLERLKVLWVDIERGVVYVQMTPYQAHALWAIQAANLPMWGERYGASSAMLATLDRLDVSAIRADRLIQPITEVGNRPAGADVLLPGREP